MDCPRAFIGYGSWQTAFPRLHNIDKRGKLSTLYPDLILSDLDDHVAEFGRGRQSEAASQDRNRKHRDDRQSSPEAIIRRERTLEDEPRITYE